MERHRRKRDESEREESYPRRHWSPATVTGHATFDEEPIPGTLISARVIPYHLVPCSRAGDQRSKGAAGSVRRYMRHEWQPFHQMDRSDRKVWALTSGEAGVVGQAVGLAEAIGWPFETRTVRLRAPWSVLPGHLGPMVLRSLREPLGPPWPDLLITGGRRTVALSIAIRRASRKRTFTVHVQNPQVPIRFFDLVVPPRHDGIRGENVLPTRGALHRITPGKLRSAASMWRERLGSPTVAVLLGGSSRTHRFTSSHATALADSLTRIDGSIVITPSRRTSPDIVAMLRRRLPEAWFWDGTGDNPYLGMLALAEHLVVTEDSVSMVSEAAATGKPVYVAAVGGGGARHRAFHALLREEGVTRPFDGGLASWHYEPIDDTARIAAEIRRRLGTPSRVEPCS